MAEADWNYGGAPTDSSAKNAADIAALRADFNSYISRTLNPIYKDFDKVKEKSETLDGSRSRKVIAKAAVRYEDLRALDRFPTRPPNYKHLGAAPNAADYNALAADVKKLYEVIGSLASILTTKL